MAVYYFDPSDLTTDADPISSEFTVIWNDRAANTTSIITEGTTPAGTKYWRFADTSGASTWNWHWLMWTATGSMPSTDGSVEALYCYRRSNDSYATGNVCFRCVDPYDETHGAAGFTGGDRNNTTEVRTRYIWDDVANNHFSDTHGLTLTTNTWYWCRVRITNDGTSAIFRVRLWKDGDSEPSTWQLEETDLSPMTHSGVGGMYLGCRTSATIDIAWFSYGTEGDPAPSEVEDNTIAELDLESVSVTLLAPTVVISTGETTVDVACQELSLELLGASLGDVDVAVDVQELSIALSEPNVSIVVGVEAVQEFYSDRGFDEHGDHLPHLTLPRVVDTSKAFIRQMGFPYGATGLASGVTTPPDCQHNYYRCRIIDASTYCLQRGWAAGSLYPNHVAWEVWEYTGNDGGPNAFTVRLTGGIEFGASVTQVDTAVSGIVDIDKCIPFITGVKSLENAVGYRSATAAFTAELVTSGGVDYLRLRRATHGLETAEVTVAIVEFTGTSWTIQKVTHTFTANNVTETESITNVGSTTNAFVYATHRHTIDDYRNSGVNVWMGSTSTVGFRLERNATASAHRVIAYVASNPNLVVTHINSIETSGYEVIPSSSTRPQLVNQTLPSAVADLTRTGVICTNTYDGTATNTSVFFQARLTSTTNLRFWRNLASSYSHWTAQVIEFPQDISGVSSTITVGLQELDLALLNVTLDITVIPTTTIFITETLSVALAQLNATPSITEETQVVVTVMGPLGIFFSAPRTASVPALATPDVSADPGVAVCSYCGKRLYGGDEYINRDGLTVCKDDLDPQHPQDLVRPRPTGEGKAKRKHNPELIIRWVDGNIDPEDEY
jgi:hypothetical protein